MYRVVYARICLPAFLCTGWYMPVYASLPPYVLGGICPYMPLYMLPGVYTPVYAPCIPW